MRRHISETLHLGMLLAAVGGFLDAYTYLSRGKVFANAQTGNLVLLGIRAFEGDWQTALHYVVPVCAFVLGVVLAESIRFRRDRFMTLHWRQLVLIQEIAFLLIVGFLPHSVDPLANALVSFVCAMQVHTFHKVHGHAYASTMCIGNLRCASEALSEYLHSHDRRSFEAARTYFGVILVFAAGAGLGSFVTEAADIRAIWVCCGLLLVSFALMFVRDERES